MQGDLTRKCAAVSRARAHEGAAAGNGVRPSDAQIPSGSWETGQDSGGQ